MALRLAEKLVQRGFLIISGGGGGIMEAANRGAGPGNSFGLNIKLPFEQKSNPYIQSDPKSLMNFKYFFTRKLMFIKESDATVLFPGGFGTHDEGFESLTLFQTGKSLPRPVVFVEPEGGNYWKTWVDYIKRELLEPGYISPEDLNLYHISNSVDDAADYIANFYYAYHSLRYVRELTVMRFTRAIPEPLLETLNRNYKDILRDGSIQTSGPLPDEIKKNDFLGLPRLTLNFNKRSFGRLVEMIKDINHTLSASKSP
jgi:hypothetical protein